MCFATPRYPVPPDMAKMQAKANEYHQEFLRRSQQRTQEEYEMAFPFITTPNYLKWAQTRRYTNSLIQELGKDWHLGDLPGYVYQDKAYIAMYRTSHGRLLYMMDYHPTIHITEDLQEAEAWTWEHFAKFQPLNDEFHQELKIDAGHM